MGTVCKHIHAVQRVNSENPQQQQAGSCIPFELASLTSYVNVAPPSETTEIKDSIKEKLASLEHLVNQSENMEALKNLNKQLNAASSAFQAFSKYGQHPKQPLPRLESPANKNMETQRRFYSTKKKRTKPAVVRYAPPTLEEKELYYSILTQSTSCLDSAYDPRDPTAD